VFETLTMPPVSAAARVFISYKRNTPLDEPLARQLHDAFRQAGHTVFIDQTMKIGVEWAREIERQIVASDYMVILLSEASVNSEMVAMELECAYKAMQRTGKARLLPVRVGYDELDVDGLSRWAQRPGRIDTDALWRACPCREAQ
jgi:hypothetical protein